MSKKRKLAGIFWIIVVITTLLVCWLGAYSLTAWFYGWIGAEPRELYRHMITSCVGFIFWGLIIGLVGRYIRRHNDVFSQMIDAMRRIANGDFNVSIDSSRAGDFTELIDSVNHMAVQLGQMEAMRQEFISNVSHEIQSPLLSIGGFARALQREDLTASEHKRYLQIIETECRRLSKLSDNLLKLTSLESGHHPFELREYRLDKQLRNLILLTEPQWSAKDIEMVAELEEIRVQADEELLSQVWINLLHNSIKFTPEGGTVTVTLSTAPEGGAQVVIADTGIGLDEEAREHIFERFYKADKSRNRGAGGSGLGLAIVRNILDKHQASIRVESEPGQGTSMIVTLPRTSERNGNTGK